MNFRSIALVISVLLAVSAEQRLNAGKPQQNIPLNVAFTNLAIYNMQGDGMGIYEHGQNRVIAYINIGSTRVSLSTPTRAPAAVS
jgi:hypothetical protein